MNVSTRPRGQFPLAGLSRLRRRSSDAWNATGEYIRTRSRFLPFYLVAISMALFSGAVLSLGVTKLDLILIAAWSGIMLLFLPLQASLLLLVALAYVIVGMTVYFTSIGAAFWGPYMIGALLAIRALVYAMGPESAARRATSIGNPMEWAMLTFVVVVSAATLLTPPKVGYPVLLGVRNYFFLWSVYFLLSRGAVPERFFDRLWLLFAGVACLQLPVTVYQHFFVASKRNELNSWDSVVGTFGGFQDAGGDSGGMAFFLVMIMTLTVALLRQRAIPILTAVLLIFCSVGSILMAEVKVVMVLIPLAAMGLFGRQIFRNPLASIPALGLATALVLGILNFYATSYSYDSNSVDRRSIVERLTDSFTYSLDARNVSYRTGELGRMAAIAFWAQEQARQEPTSWIVGHGIGSTLGGEEGKSGAVATQYRPLNLNSSAVAILLWDTGLLGLAAFNIVIAIGTYYAWRMVGNARMPPKHRAYMETAAICLPLFVPMEMYNNGAAGGIATAQLTLVLLLGYIAFWRNRLGQSASED